jgi:hypothetical protein
MKKPWWCSSLMWEKRTQWQNRETSSVHIRITLDASETMLHIHYVLPPCLMGRLNWKSGRWNLAPGKHGVDGQNLLLLRRLRLLHRVPLRYPRVILCVHLHGYVWFYGYQFHGIPRSLNLTTSPTLPSFSGFDLGISSFWPWMMRHNMTFFHLPWKLWRASHDTGKSYGGWWQGLMCLHPAVNSFKCLRCRFYRLVRDKLRHTWTADFATNETDAGVLYSDGDMRLNIRREEQAFSK